MYPTRPAEYDGYTFENTVAVGGYGAPTAKHYDLEVRYTMPFGTMGQSNRPYESLVMDKDTCKPRYSIFTMIPKPTNTFLALPKYLGTEDNVNITF